MLSEFELNVIAERVASIVLSRLTGASEQPITPDPSEYISAKEVCAMLNICKHTFYNRHYCDLIPFIVMPGGRKMYVRSEVGKVLYREGVQLAHQRQGQKKNNPTT